MQKETQHDAEGAGMNTRLGVVMLALIMAIFVVACGSGGATAQSKQANAVPVPTEFTKGEQLFSANCAICHGEQARGTPQGPPLVNKIYEPSHHPDITFLMAVRGGVRQHHWQFGNMLPLPAVTDEQVKDITAYIRWLQRQAGIN
jgi:mono/diheme cytochrome c family protein